MPVVSVITPTFNRAATIGRALDATLSQSYPYLQIIVVDDASTDVTGEIVKTYADERIQYVRHESNRGAAAARNTGLEIATGDFVSFLDSDDLWLPQRVDHFIRAAQADGDAAKTTVYYGQTINDDGLKRLVLPRRAKRKDESVATYTFRFNSDITMIAVMLSRELAVRVKFTERLRRHEDVDFLMRLEREGATFRFIPTPYAIYYRDERIDRISVAPDPEPSISWIQDWAHELSDHEIRAFNARIVAPLLASRGLRARSTWLVTQAAWHRSILIVDALKHLANTLLPVRISRWLKAAWGIAGGYRKATR